MQEYAPYINVIVTPKKVKKGQLISIHATIIDRFTSTPMIFDNIYLEIVDEEGVPVWPLSLVEKDSSMISKLISTAELDPGKKYTVRVSPSKHLRPIGEANFEIDHRLIPAALLIPGVQLIPHLLLSDRFSTRKEKEESDVLKPDHPIKIAWLIYQTEKDSKVCKFCMPHQGERYRPNDPDLPSIPVHPRCRCHYDVVTEEEEKQLYEAQLERYYHQQELILASIAASQAVFNN